MKLNRLGTSGLKVSAVGLGCNNFGMRCDEAKSIEIIHAALDVGINFFDTADVYGQRGLSETYLGRALKGRDRSEFVIATKFANAMKDTGTAKGASRRYIMQAVEASLRRLDMDYIDLYQQHIPDADTPIEETLRALDDLITQGKVRYIGHSIFPAGRLPMPNGQREVLDSIEWFPDKIFTTCSTEELSGRYCPPVKNMALACCLFSRSPVAC